VRVRAPSWVGIAAGLAAALLALPAAAPATTRAKTCTAKGATVVARSGTALLLTRSVGGDDLYGPGTLVTTCRKGRRPVVLLRTGPGDSVTISHPVFTPGYVAFATSSFSTACTKYLGDDPQCRSVGVASYNRRTGRRRASGGGVADILLATPAGWLAWLSPADATGSRTLRAADTAGERELAAGAIDPASLTVAGPVVSWAAGGVPASATLG
jgi:hypothetical protein